MLDATKDDDRILWNRMGATPENMPAALAAMGDGITGVNISHSQRMVGTAAIDVLRPYLHRLTDIHLLGCPLGDAGLEAIANEPLAATIDTLRISGPFTDHGLVALARSSCLPALRRLQIAGGGGTPDAWTTLLGSPVVSRLTTLVLSEAPLTEPALRALDAAGLDTLSLDRCNLRDWGAPVLATCAAMPQLVRLGVSNHWLKAPEIATLVDAHFPSLRALELMGTEIDEHVVFAIRDRRGMPALSLVVMGRQASISSGEWEDYVDQGAVVGGGYTSLWPDQLRARYFAAEPIDFVDGDRLSGADSTSRWFSSPGRSWLELR